VSELYVKVSLENFCIGGVEFLGAVTTDVIMQYGNKTRKELQHGALPSLKSEFHKHYTVLNRIFWKYIQSLGRKTSKDRITPVT
jgi:hypothetical protein